MSHVTKKYIYIYIYIAVAAKLIRAFDLADQPGFFKILYDFCIKRHTKNLYGPQREKMYLRTIF